MAEMDDERSRLKSLDEKLKKAHSDKAKKSPKTAQKNRSALGSAYRIGIEFVVAIFVSTGIGWALDKWLETTPLFLLIFFFLGVAAGFLNVYKAAERMDSGAPPDQNG